MGPILHDFDQARGDLFPSEQGLDELVPKQFPNLAKGVQWTAHQKTINYENRLLLPAAHRPPGGMWVFRHVVNSA
jgi:hypothetical protein